MKTAKTMFAIVLMLVASAMVGRSLNIKQVPKAVAQSFSQLYPQVNKAKWSKENGEYETNFTTNKKEMSALFTAQGKLLETETEMPVSQLPQNIQTNLKQNFMGYKVTEAARIESNGTTKYEAEIRKGMKSYDVIYDTDGHLLKNPLAMKQN